jgi:hypothetical protein
VEFKRAWILSSVLNRTKVLASLCYLLRGLNPLNLNVSHHMDFATLKNKQQKNVQEQIFIRYYEQVVIELATPPTLTVDNGSQS